MSLDTMLGWLSPHAGSTVVVKYGGNAMTDETLQDAFAHTIVLLHAAGIRPVVAHGGGPQITDMLKRLGIASEFRGGYRVTTPESMDVVRMVLTGQVQRDIVTRINRIKPYAVGLSGEDAHLFTAERRTATVDGESVDIGLVGDVTDVRSELINSLVDAGYIPVISSVGLSAEGEIFNVNADTAAGALAAAIGASRLLVLTDVEGLYRDWPSSSEVIREIDSSELRELLPSLDSGMIPKMEACLRAVDLGVPAAFVIDGRIPYEPVFRAFTDEWSGTRVTGEAV
ncbi:MAG: acetylglutamate kinase [Actinobacteria bacterium]|nr:acetylglutamate kinase [Actinomycetota bacterium]